jgi:4-amino-4-deoxy-L-arabinose transferase-like glycosyltransferase
MELFVLFLFLSFGAGFFKPRLQMKWKVFLLLLLCLLLVFAYYFLNQI